ncbi:MAG: helix-turn-helix domain-containing protein, partial [Planctomycetes bacterium]|nr:helix-turn-helix domain-containing protein [Planctomycetota bacterium]
GVSFIHFTPSEDCDDVPEVHHVRDVAYVDAVMRRVIDLMQGGEAALARSLLAVLAIDLRQGHATHRPAEGAGGTGRHHEQVAQEAAALLRESPGEALDIARLARRAGYSPDHFTRVFRQVLGQTPQAYAIDQRINRARVLLDETGLTVAGVAHALGYQNVPLFCRQFKARVGRTPGGYRYRGGTDNAG